MSDEAHSDLEAARAALEEFETRRAATLAELKAEAADVNARYQAAEAAHNKAPEDPPHVGDEAHADQNVVEG